jgi:hypothetical protein
MPVEFDGEWSGEGTPPQFGGVNFGWERGATMSGRTHTTSLTRRGSLRALLLCTLSLGMGGTRARADSRLDFTLQNRLGVTINSVYLSPHQVPKWEEDVLGTGTLADGGDIRIHFAPGDENRGDLWDMKVVTSENNVYTWQSPGFKLTQISAITIYIRGGQATASSR